MLGNQCYGDEFFCASETIKPMLVNINIYADNAGKSMLVTIKYLCYWKKKSVVLRLKINANDGEKSVLVILENLWWRDLKIYPNEDTKSMLMMIKNLC